MLLRASRIVVSAVVVILAAAMPVRAQILTIAHIGDTHLFDPVRTNPDVARQELLENYHALIAAVLSINALVTSGTRIDCVVFTGGFGINALTSDDLDARAAEISRVFGALLVRRLLILGSESDIAADGSTASYDRFVAALRSALPGHEIIDLEKDDGVVAGFHVIGLNSVPMISRRDARESAARQVAALERVRRRLVPKRQVVLFTHVPPVKEQAASTSADVIDSDRWTLASAATPAWRDVVSRPDLLAVFAGHVQVTDRARYGKAESLLHDPAVTAWPPRLWVTPPLSGAPSQPGTEPTRGFQVATVAANGTVSVTVHWLFSSDFARKPINAHLFKGRNYEQRWELDKAISAYDEALKATDTRDQAEAQEAFVRARRSMDSWRWWLVQQNAPILFLYDHFVPVSVLVLLVGLLLAVSYSNPDPLIDPPTKLTNDAPADLFMAEFFAAADEIKDTLGTERTRHLFVTSSGTVLVRPTADDLGTILNDLPPLSGINIGTIVATVRKYARYLRRRLELQISGTADDVKAFGILRHAGRTVRSWKEPETGGPATDVVAVARRMAYNVIWEVRK